MNDGMLSQEEIDALLNGTSEIDKEPSNDDKSDDFLTLVEKDALGEIGNISFGNSATALSTLLNQKVDITTPEVSVIRKDNLDDMFQKPFVATSVDYTAGFSGSNLLVIKESDASIIADLMLGGDGQNSPTDIGDLQLSAVQEAMNQMMGNAATSMSTIFQKRVDISPPTISILNIPEGTGTENLPSADYLVAISFRLIVGELINSSIMQLFSIPFAKELVSQLMNPVNDDPVPNDTAPEVIPVNEYADIPYINEQNVYQSEQHFNQPSTYKQITEMDSNNYNNQHNQVVEDRYVPGSNTEHQEKKNVQPAVFQDFQSVPNPVREPRNLEMLFDIPLQVTVELGRTSKVVKDILELSPGSIVELDKLAGEPVDILVNSKLIAKGEVVVIEENFGVRITDVVSQTERIKNMN
jgi:flagellar motor switch protein FliN